MARRVSRWVSQKFMVSSWWSQNLWSNIGINVIDLFLGLLMGFFQGSDVVVKVLVVGVGHLGEKWERIGWVGPYERDYERVGSL
jgi:hypothetical protein